MILLPGLLTLVVFAGLCAALSRWYDPLPRRMMALAVVLVTLLFGRALFAGTVLLPLNLLWGTPPFQDLERVAPLGYGLQWDQVEDLLPYAVQTRALLARGEWPLLAANVGAGEPLLGNLQAQHFNPLRATTYLVPLAAAPGVEAALKLLVAFTFTFLLLRRIGTSEPAAAAGGLSYALSGFMLLYLGWPHTQSAAALPLLLYGVELTVSRAASRDAVLLAIGLATLIFGGHPETIVYAVAAASLFGCERWWECTTGEPWRRRLWRLVPIGGAVTLAVGLASPVILPGLNAITQSERQRMVDRNTAQVLAEASDGSSDAGGASDEEPLVVMRAVPVLAPLAYGSQRYGQPWGFRSGLQDGSAFAGTAALILVLAGIWRRRGWLPGERSLGIAALAALVFFVQPPGLVPLMKALPILSQSASENRRLAMVVCFGVAYLAACTWHRLMRDGRGSAAAALVALGALGLLQWAYRAHYNPDNLLDQLGARTTFWFLQSAVVLALLAVVWARRWSAAGWPRSPSGPLAYSLAALVFLELYPLHGPLNASMPRSHFFPQRPSIDFLQKSLGNDRLTGLGDVFRRNYPAVYGLADIRSGNPLKPADVVRVTRLLRPEIDNASVTVADHPLLDLLGVRYVLSEKGRQLEAPLRLVFEGNLWIWERPAPLPRLFLPRSARQFRPGDRRRQLSSVHDFQALALLSELPNKRPSWRALAWRRASVSDLEIGTDRVSAHVRASRRALLASSIYQDGGWRVLRNGEPLADVRTNLAFVGAWLSGGDHSIVLLYRPPGFLAGCALSALAIACGLAVTVRPPADAEGGASLTRAFPPRGRFGLDAAPL